MCRLPLPPLCLLEAPTITITVTHGHTPEQVKAAMVHLPHSCGFMLRLSGRLVSALLTSSAVAQLVGTGTLCDVAHCHKWNLSCLSYGLDKATARDSLKKASWQQELWRRSLLASEWISSRDGALDQGTGITLRGTHQRPSSNLAPFAEVPTTSPNSTAGECGGGLAHKLTSPGWPPCFKSKRTAVPEGS